MRIISGYLKGRRFEMPNSGWKTRPTTDMAREALFNILQHKIDLTNILVLDLFAGSGAVSYEFISRGAKVIAVEKFGACIQFINKTSQVLEIKDQLELIKAEVFQYLKTFSSTPFDLIFADPPYAMREMLKIPDLVFSKNILKENGWLIIEHDDRVNFENHANFMEVRKYGQSRFSFFSN